MNPLRQIRSSARRLLNFFPGLLDAGRSVRDAMEFRKPARRAPHGFSIRGPKIMQDGAFEAEEVDFLKSLSGEFEVFVNVGANVGYFTLLAAALGRRVVAVEASPKMRRGSLRT